MTDKKTELGRWASDWEIVNQELRRGDVSADKVAVLEADKVLRAALEEKYLPGRTIEDQLEGSSKLFSNFDKLRYARAMHDKLVDKLSFNINSEDAREIIKGYHDALLDLENADLDALPLGEKINLFLRRNFFSLPGRLKQLLLILVLFSAATFILSETDAGHSVSSGVIALNDYIYYQIIPTTVFILLVLAAVTIAYYAYQHRNKQ
jgi:cell division protein FtsL